MSDDCQREMTLQEWVEQLPDTHSARKEYAVLKAKVEKFTCTDKPSVPCITCEVCHVSAPFIKTKTGYRCQKHWDKCSFETQSRTMPKTCKCGKELEGRLVMVCPGGCPPSLDDSAHSLYIERVPNIIAALEKELHENYQPSHPFTRDDVIQWLRKHYNSKA